MSNTQAESQVPKKQKRTAKSPTQAAQANADAAIVQLENLGGRLFKIDKPELTEGVRHILDSLRTMREQL